MNYTSLRKRLSKSLRKFKADSKRWRKTKLRGFAKAARRNLHASRRLRHLLRILLRKPRHVSPNKVRGGRPEKRLLFAARLAEQHYRHYYSEKGTLTLDFGITNVPNDSYRSDCSTAFTALYKACGLHDPNNLHYGGDPYTGTLLEGGKEVSRRFAEYHAGCAVVFGSGTGIHVGMSTGEGPTIIQHGKEPMEGGTFDEFGPGVEVRYRYYL